MVLTESNTQAIAINPLVVQNDDILDIMWGLKQSQKTIPPKYFYDQRGSQLFDQICKLDVYYLPRAETSIMKKYIDEITALIGPDSILIEYGSGSSVKTRLLLDSLPALAAYVPVDISQDHLFRTAKSLARIYPNLEISPLGVDFTKPFSIPLVEDVHSKKVAYFPGSTIGNFYPRQAIDFMRNVASLIGPGGGFLIGFDLQKDPAILNRAYNDPDGITAAFNLNMLTHINEKFYANFVEHQYEHLAFYNQSENRIEMHLVSKEDQLVNINGSQISFYQGERILTEVSYKYSFESFAWLSQQAGFNLHGIWVDPKNYFCIQYLEFKDDEP